MVGSIGSTNNLIQILSINIQKKSAGVQFPQDSRQPPRQQGAEANSQLQKPPGGPSFSGGQINRDPLGVFPTVDQNSDHAISESEYLVLQEGIKNVTGKEITGNFQDYDTDGDGVLNGAELKTVLDQAGFTPPASPPSQGIAAYEAQNRTKAENGSLQQLVDYLRNRSTNFNVQA